MISNQCNLKNPFLKTWDKLRRERIRCKPTSPCKLWKLQSESLDQHSRGIGDWVILQSGPALGLDNHIFANPPSHLSTPLSLDVDLIVQIGVFIVCTKMLVCTWYVPKIYYFRLSHTTGVLHAWVNSMAPFSASQPVATPLHAFFSASSFKQLFGVFWCHCGWKENESCRIVVVIFSGKWWQVVSSSFCGSFCLTC